MLSDSSGQFDGLTTNAPTTDLNSIISTFTDSQTRAYRWVESQLTAGKQIKVAIVGPAGTGKSYLLRGLIELLKSKHFTHTHTHTHVHTSGVPFTLSICYCVLHY